MSMSYVTGASAGNGFTIYSDHFHFGDVVYNQLDIYTGVAGYAKFSVPAEFPDGSVSSPSIYGSNDTDSGIWFSSADVKIGRNGNEKFATQSFGTKTTGNHNVTGYVYQDTPIAVRIKRTTDLTGLSSGSVYAVPFGAEDYDFQGMHDNTSGSNYQITVPIDGVYLVTATGHWEGKNAVGTRSVGVLLNPTSINTSTHVVTGGSLVVLDRDHNPDATHESYLNCSGILSLSANDVLVMRIYQDSGTTMDFHAEDDNSPRLAVALIG
jgi:hypothetical protein